MIAHEQQYLGSGLEARYIMTKGWLYHQLGQLDSAEWALNEALALAEIQQNKQTLGQIYNFLAVVHATKTNYQGSLDYYYKNLKTLDTLSNHYQFANWHSSVGHLYRKMAEYDKAETHLLRANEIMDLFENKPIHLATRLTIVNELANVYYALEQYDRVFEMDKEIVQLSRASKNTRQLAFALNNLGEDHAQRGEYGVALDLYKESIQLKKIIGKHYVFSSYVNVVNLYAKWKPDDPDALAYLDSARQLAHSGTLDQMAQVYYYDYELEQARSNYQSALKAYKVYKSYQDSIFNETKAKNIAELEKKYKNEQAKAENIQLQKINLQKSQTNLVLIIGSIILLLLFLVLAFLYSRLAKSKRLIQSQSEQLQKLNQIKSDFFANISHELRTPLTLLKGHLETISSKYGQDIALQKIEKANRNVSQIALMIDDLLDLSKYELQQARLKNVPTPINLFLTRVLASFQSLSDEKGIVLHLDSSVDDRVHLNLDPRQFEKVISNLIYNSFKFSSKGTTIHISLVRNDFGFSLRVQDQGPGIAQVDLPYIFDRFYRSKNQQNVEGTGLGLAIAKEIVEQHTGSITVESKTGSGAIFTIQLPLDLELKEGNTHEEDDTDIDAFIREKMLKWQVDRPLIMVVEDNHEMQQYLQEILSDTFRIICHNNGAEALAQLKTKRPSMIISDVMMPHMDGFELLKRIKDHIDHRSIPIMLVTARGSEDYKMAALRMGVDDYIVKPFDPKELLIRVCTIIDNLQSRLKANTTDPTNGAEESSTPNLATADDEVLLIRLKDYILTRVSDEQLQVNDLADHVSMSLRQLYRRLAKLTGLTPNEFIMEVKLQHARKLLLAGKVTKVSSLAAELGIATPAYFTRQFYKRFGKRPSDFL